MFCCRNGNIQYGALAQILVPGYAVCGRQGGDSSDLRALPCRCGSLGQSGQAFRGAGGQVGGLDGGESGEQVSGDVSVDPGPASTPSPHSWNVSEVGLRS